MSAVSETLARQYAAAAAVYENASPDDDSAHEEAVAELAERYANDPAMCRKADDWNDGMQDGEHYSAVERALADLGECSLSAILAGVSLPAVRNSIARIHALAEVHAKARKARLTEWAREEVERENAENATTYAEAMADARCGR